MHPKIETTLRPRLQRGAGPGYAAAGRPPHEHLYARIARALRKEIAEGVYPAGSRLPTEGDLCRRFRASRFTVREALRRLRAENLVISRPRAGTRVMPRPDFDADPQDITSINDLVSWSAGKSFAIESMGMLVIDEELASRTGLASGEKWLAARGLGYVEGTEQPACWAEYFINREFAAVGRALPGHCGPIFPLIEHLFGHRIVDVHQEIRATLIPAALARGLEVEAGTAGLEVRRTYKTSRGLTAQVTVSTHPACHYRYSSTLRRVRG